MGRRVRSVPERRENALNWLKSQTAHAHGLSSPVYTYIKGQDLEDVKYEIRHGPDGDRDGFREPKWEVMENLPPEILAKKIKEAESNVASATRWLAMLREM